MLGSHANFLRFQSCQAKQYPANLPTASVVIIFKDERWSPLLRTVYSVLHRFDFVAYDFRSDFCLIFLVFYEKIAKTFAQRNHIG
jgi:hypothetical protein